MTQQIVMSVKRADLFNCVPINLLVFHINFKKNLFGDYGLNGVSPYGSEQEKRPKSAFEDSTNVSKFGKGTTEYYSLPISDIKNECRATVKLLSTFVDDLSTILSQVNLDPYSDPTLEESHRHIWNKLNIGFNQVEPIDPSPKWVVVPTIWVKWNVTFG